MQNNFMRAFFTLKMYACFEYEKPTNSLEIMNNLKLDL